MSVDFEEFVLFDCQLSIVNCQLSIQKTMSYLFTSESVSEGHPDKVADQISDALLDEFLAYDKNSKVACETLVTTGQVVLSRISINSARKRNY